MKRKYIKLVHIIFWSLTLIAIGLSSIPLFGKDELYFIVWDFIIYAISYISIFYVFYFFVTKKILKKNYLTYFTIFGFLFTVAFSAFASIIYFYVINPELIRQGGSVFLLDYGRTIILFVETNFIFALSGSLIKIAFLWYESFIKQKEIEKQLISTELALLKTQINPDFLLNTLKDFKSRIEDKPDTAINIIDKLAEIMNYMLYDSSKEKVPMEKEINFIKTYLDLQKIRFKKNDLVEFSFTEGIKKFKIAPLIFLPFIESVFKSADLKSVNPSIRISLGFEDSSLVFEIIKVSSDSDLTKEFHKINLHNSIKRRLDLLFKNNYSLREKTDKGINTIKLKIGLID
jgi:two-component system, LytTR family, sensor kinase